MAEAPLYGRVSAEVTAAGWPVSAAQVHAYVRRRLLPPLGVRYSLGRRGFRTELRAGAIEQLRALGQLRAHTSSINALRVLMWLDGWPIPTSDVHAALAGFLPKPEMDQLTDDARDRISQQALEKALGFRRRLGRTGLRRMEAAEAAEYVARRMLGDRPATGPDLNDILERALGLDRARRDRFRESAPWLEGKVDVPKLFDGLSLRELTELVASASDEELGRARTRARFLVWELPKLVEMMEILGGRGFGGLHAASGLGPSNPELAVLVALRCDRQGLGANLDDLVAAMRTNDMQDAVALLPRARRFVDNHPQRNLIRRRGLLAHLLGSE